MNPFASYILLLTVIVVLVIGLFGCNDHHRRISDTLESEGTTTVPPSHEQLVEEKLDEIISLLKEIKNKK
jgi:hypothetical protein